MPEGEELTICSYYIVSVLSGRICCGGSKGWGERNKQTWIGRWAAAAMQTCSEGRVQQVCSSVSLGGTALIGSVCESSGLAAPNERHEIPHGGQNETYSELLRQKNMLRDAPVDEMMHANLKSCDD
jgi:hypothetical protein